MRLFSNPAESDHENCSNRWRRNRSRSNSDEALKVLDAVSRIDGFQFELNHLDWGSERYMKSGEIIPDGGIDLLQTT